MTTTRPPCQWELAFPTPDPGEAAGRHGQEAEMVTAAPGPESPAVSEPRSPLNPPNRRGTDPYARWCGRGGTARCPPIPIGLFRHEHGATISRRSGCFRGTFLMRQRPRLGNISGEAMRTSGFLILFGLLAGFGDQAASMNRRLRRSKLARPNIWRLIIFSRLIWPSTCPVLQGSVRAARTAS